MSRLPSLRVGLALLARCLIVMLAVALVPSVYAAGDEQSPMLHEYIEPDPEEDLALRTTTFNGAMPAALDTPSGVVRAPELRPPGTAPGTVYGGSSTPYSQDATYRIDRDTTRPEVVGYDDPFIPSVTPFKRLYAYDAVSDSLELVVHDKTLSTIPIGSGTLTSSDDQFFADMVVDLAEDQAVRIPSVGPGVRVLTASTSPRVKFELLRDGADNWFIRSPSRARARLVMQLAIERAAYGGAYPDVTESMLSSELPPLPPLARDAALAVLQELGIPIALTPAAALATLVAHFRSFAPSRDRPTSRGAALYQELALSRRGVCRHRSYAFVITAQALGIPARLVRNEAHAWVEVYDGRIWRRIDLGGAAGRLEMNRDENVAQHVPPPDPFHWPEGSESGLDMANRVPGREPAAPVGDQRVAHPPPDQAPDRAEPKPAQVGSAGADSGEDPEQEGRPPAELTLKAEGGAVKRGSPLELAGHVTTNGVGCEGARVDVALRSESGRRFLLGSLPAGADGQYQGAVTVRLDLEVGDYQLVVSTPGNADCGPGALE
jgi:hypothetical protein